MLLLALLDEEDETRRDAHADRQAAQHVQPSQQPVSKVLQVQARQKSVDGAGYQNEIVADSSNVLGTLSDTEPLP